MRDAGYGVIVGFQMEEKIEQAYLYDFYGELLNTHQRTIYEDFVFHDLSLSEIASEEGISRQGVHDVVRRCQKTLEEYEQKLHLVEKFLFVKDRVARIKDLVEDLEQKGQEPVVAKIRKISDEILEEL